MYFLCHIIIEVNLFLCGISIFTAVYNKMFEISSKQNPNILITIYKIKISAVKARKT